jgi:hypothetical protein
MAALFLVAVAVTVVGVIWIVPKMRFEMGMVELSKIRIPMCKSIDQLKERTPVGVDSKEWEWCVELTKSAYNNVCFSPQEVRIEDMIHLRDDVRRRLEGDAKGDPATLLWLWDRLNQAGPGASRIVEKDRASFLESLKSCTRQKNVTYSF